MNNSGKFIEQQKHSSHNRNPDKMDSSVHVEWHCSATGELESCMGQGLSVEDKKHKLARKGKDTAQ